MGTNYYLYRDVCGHCGRGDAPRHIGKSSAGWAFALHVYPEEGIPDLEGWKRAWKEPGTAIKSEYGDVLSPEGLLSVIEGRSRERSTKAPFGYASWDDFHRSNHSEPGPNNLVRSKVDGERCVGHGPGTWDLMVGEFS